MADPMKRVEAWKAKTTPERTKQCWKPGMRRCSKGTGRDGPIVRNGDQVKTVINARGVHTSLYVPYLNFAGSFGSSPAAGNLRRELCYGRSGPARQVASAGLNPTCSPQSGPSLRHRGTEAVVLPLSAANSGRAFAALPVLCVAVRLRHVQIHGRTTISQPSGNGS